MDRVDIRKRIISNQKKVEVLTELINMLKENIKEDQLDLEKEYLIINHIKSKLSLKKDNEKILLVLIFK